MSYSKSPGALQEKNAIINLEMYVLKKFVSLKIISLLSFLNIGQQVWMFTEKIEKFLVD